jgi:hypothetical protein
VKSIVLLNSPPLAFVVAEKLLVIHGGLWRHRGVTLSQLRKLNNRKHNNRQLRHRVPHPSSGTRPLLSAGYF